MDFDSDRCRLDGESHVAGETAPESIILDGSTTYTRESNARWVFARGAEGTRGMFHPSGLLDALVRAQTSAVEVGERWVELGLDHDVLDASADAGLAPDWQSTAVARISPSGRISNIALTHRSGEDPDSLMRVECAISEPLQGQQRKPAQAGGLNRARRCHAEHPILPSLPSSPGAPQAARFGGNGPSGPASWPVAD